jgi:transcriptional regulator with XRE-family HTH domain
MVDSSETFPEVLADLMQHYNVNASDVARAIGGSPSTVSTWVRRHKTPRAETLRALAEEYPAFPLERLTAAAGRTLAIPADADRRARLLALFDQLTEAQQELIEVQLHSLVVHNQRKLGASFLRS